MIVINILYYHIYIYRVICFNLYHSILEYKHFSYAFFQYGYIQIDIFDIWFHYTYKQICIGCFHYYIYE